ncbi:ExbD/TolR family protein [Herbaspirillum chlorophenolicum]|uniref:ExbD/TolR family protein n=1 Tax=Herbaspirillum chlorophenolicum TaxID=211589 RepID=A0ABW8EV59_9BURK|nr:biopolymer transporter ExbD [Herbaspirillum chlorophenolicum]
MAINTGAPSGSDDDAPMLEMNMTPLIDVMLVLIIMFIITIPIQNHMVELNMPAPAPAVQPPRLPQTQTIDVTVDGTLLWNGVILAGRAELEEKLGEVARQADQDEVHIRPNKLAPYRVVAAVLAATQRAGVIKLGLVGNEQFLDS